MFRSNLSTALRLVLRCSLLLCFADLLAPGVYGADGDQNWDARFGSLPPGVDNEVNSMLAIGEHLYIGGDFKRAGGVLSPGVARFDGTNWHEVGRGVHGVVRALAQYGSNLVVGGTFDRAGYTAATNLALWTGAEWLAIGNTDRPLHPIEFPFSITAVWAEGSDLYVGGEFHSIGGVAATNIARWNGIEWSAMGTGLALPAFALGGGFEMPAAGSVFGIARFGDKLYAAGRFTHAGETAVSHIAAWNGVDWEPLASGLSGGQSGIFWEEDVYGVVYSVAASENGLYVAGDFTHAGTVAATNLAKWNGSNWASITFPGTAEFVGVERSDSDQLFLSGRFHLDNDPAAYGLLEYRDGEWIPHAPEVAGWVKCVSPFNNDLYVAGYFSAVADMDAAHIARRTGQDWSTLGEGTGSLLFPSFQVKCMAADSQYLYAGGWGFPGAGKAFGSLVARWDGANWTSLLSQTGWQETISQSLFMGGKLFVAGQFTLPEIGATNLACWDGVSWSALAPVVYSADRPEMLLATEGNVLYAIGSFTNAGGIEVNGLAQWDGSHWSSVGNPSAYPWANERIESIAASSSDLYIAAGWWQGRVYQWDGSDWTTLPGPFSDTNWLSIDKMVVREDELIVAGQFSRIGEVPVTSIARWNGSSWDGMGNPFAEGGHILDMVVSGANLYVAGSFTNTLTSVQAIARWDGQQWSSLGSGVQHQPPDSAAVHALAVHGRKLYMAGGFDQTGRHNRSGMALWHDLPRIRLQPLSNMNEQIVLQANGLSGLPFILETSSDLQNWIPYRWGTFEADSITLDIEKSDGDERYFRLSAEP